MSALTGQIAMGLAYIPILLGLAAVYYVLFDTLRREGAFNVRRWLR